MPLDTWARAGVDLDFARAVTLVAMISATIPAPEPYRANGGNQKLHVAEAFWDLQDSLSGDTWHRVAGGRLVAGATSDAVRVSAPVGIAVRLVVFPRVCVFPAWGSGPTAHGDPVPCDGACGIDHDQFAPREFEAHLAVRSI